MKIPLFNTLLKGPEATNEAPRLSELERIVMRRVIDETDASAREGAFAVARHSADPQLPFIQQDVASQAIKNTPEATNAPYTVPTQEKLDTAFEFLGFPTESVATVPQQTPVATPETSMENNADVIDLNAVREKIARQFSELGEGDGTQAAA